MSTFAETGISPELLRGIEELGFAEPTPIQARVIPLLLQGSRDVVALAQTGTGKTAAFGLPLLQLTNPDLPAIQAVVLCPTRELCLQITRDISNYGRFAPRLQTLAVYGGSSIQAQIRALRDGVHILVATPGRLHDLLRRGVARLDQVQRVVLDEADEMLNMGFEEDLEAILQEVPEDVRILLFSATMPKQVAAIAAEYMEDPEEVSVTSNQSGAARIQHVCHVIHARERYEALTRILNANPLFYGIVFCRTRAQTQELCSALQADHYSADALHGDLSQEQRNRVMRQFRNRHTRILIATDVAARGLDVNDITHVIHFDLPGDAEVYIHRSGRTGRAGKSGVSILLAHMREEGKIRAIERILKKNFERLPVPSGTDICSTRLNTLLEELADGTIEHDLLDPYREAYTERLKHRTREEILALLILRDMGSLIRHYRNAPDLGMSADVSEGPRRKSKEKKSDKGPGAFAPHHPDEPFFAVRVNIGRRNGITPALLISMINRATPGPMLPLGRIRVLDTDSLFEIPGNAVEVVINNLNKMVVKKRPVRAVPANR